MRSVPLLLFSGLLSQLSAAIIFPAGYLVKDTACTLPSPTPSSETFFLATDVGQVTVTGSPAPNSFITTSILTNLSPSGANVTVFINPARLNKGANEASIIFKISGTNAYAGTLTIEIDCFPTPTIILSPPTTVPLQVTRGTGPLSVVLPGAVNPTNVDTSSVSFTMTPDTPPGFPAWITSGSIPGSPANFGTISPNSDADLTVTLNPTGLPAQNEPYIGFLHLRDTNTGQGAADLAVQLTVVPPASGNARLPHFAINGVWVTDFYIVNSAGQSANYTINFLSDSGAPKPVLVQGVGVNNTIQGTLPAYGSAVFEIGDPTQSVDGGSAQIVADSSIAIQALFRLHQQDSSGSHYFEAAVPSEAGGLEFVFPFDATTFAPTGEQIFTGFAIANTDPANASSISCQATDQSGNPIPSGVQVPSLPPNGHWAGFNFPALMGKRGIVDCTGTTVIAAIALHSFAQSGAISSLPVVFK